MSCRAHRNNSAGVRVNPEGIRVRRAAALSDSRILIRSSDQSRRDSYLPHSGALGSRFLFACCAPTIIVLESEENGDKVHYGQSPFSSTHLPQKLLSSQIQKDYSGTGEHEIRNDKPRHAHTFHTNNKPHEVSDIFDRKNSGNIL